LYYYYDMIHNVHRFISEFPHCFGVHYMDKHYSVVCEQCGFRSRCESAKRGQFNIKKLG